MKNHVPYDTKSTSPDDVCEDCLDTGWGGDNGPGILGNNEYCACSCDPELRRQRRTARRGFDCEASEPEIIRGRTAKMI